MQAVADYFGVRMMVVTSYPEGELIEITPRGPLLTKRALYLSFWAEVTPHFIALHLSCVDLPASAAAFGYDAVGFCRVRACTSS